MIDQIPLVETTWAFQGETVGIFQYESPGMQKHLKSLRPTADLIAMNALYRQVWIRTSFIKQATRKIEYDLPVMEDFKAWNYSLSRAGYAIVTN